MDKFIFVNKISKIGISFKVNYKMINLASENCFYNFASEITKLVNIFEGL